MGCKGHKDDLTGGAYDGHGGDINLAAEYREPRVIHQRHEAVGKGHYKAGNAEGKASFNDLRHQLHAAKAELEDSLFAGEEGEHPKGRGELGYNGGKGSALYPHIENEDKKRVEGDVYGGSKHYREHADFGKALRVDKGIHADAGEGKDGSDKVDMEIIHSVAEDVVRRAYHSKHRLRESFADDGKAHTHYKKQRVGVAEIQLRSFVVALTSCDGAKRGAAGGAKGLKGTYEQYYGRGYADTGERIGADHFQLKVGAGYDSNWVIDREDNGEVLKVADLYSPKSGRGMEVLTDQIGLQFYSGNRFNGSYNNKFGKPILLHGAVALETQSFPGAVNIPSFPSVVLEPEQTYKHTCIYRFYTK